MMEKHFDVPVPMKIKPNDLVPGEVYLRFIEEYKAYDSRQKQVIKQLQTDIDFLIFEAPCYQKMLSYKHELQLLRKEVALLRKDKERLICRNVQLENRLNHGGPIDNTTRTA